MNFALLGSLWFCLIIHVTRASVKNNSSVVVVQCITNVDCGELLTCIDLTCQDPCPGPCTGNATCEIYNHVPYCACKPGFSGNPFAGCQRVPETQRGYLLPGSRPSGTKVYRVERFFKVNYFSALLYCTTHGGRLARIESKDENKLIKDVINKTGIRNAEFWTSGTNLPMGQWVWMSSREPVLPDYSDWWPGEPNNAGDEHCLELWERDSRGYKWNDKRCTEQLYPICEYFE
ncbi:perlucin-like protein [Homalodisca vitripennis]|uniref:perlucin-like protein n=1 Tax=Homalodisca vitripennis TaxID=197043 RepID=UPI001EEA66D7|nr:perlucin-like protein [Homalodisca vitripennis]